MCLDQGGGGDNLSCDAELCVGESQKLKVAVERSILLQGNWEIWRASAFEQSRGGPD